MRGALAGIQLGPSLFGLDPPLASADGNANAAQAASVEPYVASILNLKNGLACY